MFNTKGILIGTVMASILAIVFEFIFGPWGGYLGIFLAGVVSVYMLETDYKNGAIHGAIIGVLTALVFIILLFIVAAANGEPVGLYLVGGGIITVLITMIAYGVIVGIGGITGVFAKKSGLSYRFRNQKDKM